MRLLHDEAAGGSAGEAPVPADELDLRLDVVDEQRHVVVQIEVGAVEDQRVAEDCLPRDTVHLQESNGGQVQVEVGAVEDQRVAQHRLPRDTVHLRKVTAGRFR